MVDVIGLVIVALAANIVVEKRGMSNRGLCIIALLVAIIAAPALAGVVRFDLPWLVLLASAVIGAITGLTVLFLIKRFPSKNRINRCVTFL